MIKLLVDAIRPMDHHARSQFRRKDRISFLNKSCPHPYVEYLSESLYTDFLLPRLNDRLRLLGLYVRPVRPKKKSDLLPIPGN